MADLSGSTIASTFDRLLALPSGGGGTTTLKALTDGDADTTFALQLSTTSICIDNPTTSSSTEGGLLRLQSDDGAVMASGHRLGVIEFGGAEDTSNTITNGARIEAVTDAIWSASENGANLNFYTTDGNASETQKMTILAAGNVGIGDTTPSNLFGISSTTAPQFRITHTDDTDYATFSVDGDGQLDITTVDGGGTAGHICLMPDGYVGIGTAAPATLFHVNSTVTSATTIAEFFANTTTDGAQVELFIGKSAATNRCSVFGHWYDSTATDSYAFLHLHGTTIGNGLTVHNDGEVAIGTTSLVANNRLTVKNFNSSAPCYIGIDAATAGQDTGLKFYDGGDIKWTVANQASDDYIVIHDSDTPSGVKMGPAATSFESYSDRDLKKDITNITAALSKVNQINGVYYKFKTDPDTLPSGMEANRRPGLIAQEVEAVFPEATDTHEGAGKWGLRYTDMIPLLVEAVKELSAKVTALENA